MKTIVIDDLTIVIERKKIKNMYLKVLPPEGNVHITAPVRMGEDEIKRFVNSKIEWIQVQQQKLQQRHTHQPLNYINGESIYLWGEEYLLSVVETTSRPSVSRIQEKLILKTKPDSTLEQKKKVIDLMYKEELNRAIPLLIEKWEIIIGVSSTGFRIRDMKTRWGTCNIRTKKICLSLQLAKLPHKCLEYVVVHELIHLLEKSHNHIFKAYLDQFLPEWRVIKKEMNGTTGIQ